MIEILRPQANQTYAELIQTLEGIDESQAWAEPPIDQEHLHTNGSIIDIVEHVASCKIMYASTAFKNTEVRWRDCRDRALALSSDWQRHKTYLEEAQAYWLDSWADLEPSQLEERRPTNWGELWPTWRIIHTITHHDSYHAGQIALIKAMNLRSETPPEPSAATMHLYVGDEPSW